MPETTLAVPTGTGLGGNERGPLPLTDATFDEAITTRQGVGLVDFGADRCPPCRRMKPVIEQLAPRYAGRATIATLDVDANPLIAARYGVRSIPTFLFFRDGEAISGIVGAVPESKLTDQLDALLAG